MAEVTIAHNFQEEIVVPFLAITNNIPYICGVEKRVTTSDGVECDTLNLKELPYEEASIEVQRIYGIPIERWLSVWCKRGIKVENIIKIKLCKRSIS